MSLRTFVETKGSITKKFEVIPLGSVIITILKTRDNNKMEKRKKKTKGENQEDQIRESRANLKQMNTMESVISLVLSSSNCLSSGLIVR